MVLGRPTPKPTEGGYSLGTDSAPAPRVSPEGLNALIGRECRIVGKLKLVGKVQLDGVVEGEIDADGELVVGESANLEAKISGNNVKVFGTVRGDITCSGKLELHSGARVIGNICSPSLVIHDGVTFEGFCSMQLGAKSEGGKALGGSSWSGKTPSNGEGVVPGAEN